MATLPSQGDGKKDMVFLPSNRMTTYELLYLSHSDLALHCRSDIHARESWKWLYAGGTKSVLILMIR